LHLDDTRLVQAPSTGIGHQREIKGVTAEIVSRPATMEAQSVGVKPMGIISWLILGLIAGFIGSKIVNKQGQGFWLDIALGIVGAIVGGFLFSEVFGTEGITGLNIWSLIVAVVGSVVVLFAYHALASRR
jgi:uncharacterized membrane protein YeaQ/YmgE (transglycosylase-associated protein family)